MDISAADLAAVGFLVFLEGVLSIDNALVLALIVSQLPHHQQKRALTYGIAGAIFFRLVAIAAAAYLMHWRWVKYVGGAYLVYLAFSHWWKKWRNKGDTPEANKSSSSANFWKTVVVVELTDIAFAVDSILTAVALSRKLWVVITGGVIGLVLMRVAATVFIKLLERFPRFEGSAYILVFVIGAKLILEALHLPGIDFHAADNPAFWVFWVMMGGGFFYGFTGAKPLAHKQHK